MQFSPLFQDHAVLQRNLSIPVWGLAAAEELVTVSLAGETAQVKTGPDGRWLVRFPALPAGGPHELIAQAESGSVTARDILIGDVWICSGQSNMEWKLVQIESAELRGALTDLPQVRLLTVTNDARLGSGQAAIDGQWTPANPKTLLNFSAVGAWFGREIHREIGVPIGLINNAWGGTRIQAWTSREALMQDPAGRDDVTRYEAELFRPAADKKYATFADWERHGAPQDSGNAGLGRGWAAPAFDDRIWPTMDLPARWQDRGHPGSGIFWFRRNVTVPAAWAGRDLELHLGQIDKHDDTYVNGERVGGLSWEAGPNSWCTPRIYPVPARLVGTDGKVTIAVRARSHVFNGGLFGPKGEMFLAPAQGGEPVPLAGPWPYAIEQDWGVVQSPAATFGPGMPNSPHILFDSRIAPLLPYGIAGVIWYQGESNANEPSLYRRLMPLMIRDWRRAWGQGDFTFLQVQLANFQAPATEPGPSEWAELREAQLAALAEPNTGLAVAIDVGDASDIHPADKRSVGLRLARWALAEHYGRGGLPGGPLYTRSTLEAGGKIRLHFRHAAGLKTRDGEPLRHLCIRSRTGNFLWAESRIEDETLLAWHPEIAAPVAVRYAWSTNPEGCNLVNRDDLPASPFRTDG